VDITFIGSFGDFLIWGGKHTQTTPNGKEVTILPLTDPQSAADVIHVYARDYGFKIVIGHMDCFGLEFLNNIKLPVIGYCPIDGPFTGKMRDYLRNYYKVIAYSKFGYSELQKWYPPTKIGFIPHGCDVENTFYPLTKKERDEVRGAFEEAYGVPKDAFLAVSLGANVGPRKCLPLLMRTWSRFAEKHDDAYLYIHTNAYSVGGGMGGYDLISHRINLKMEKRIHFPTYNPIIQPAPDNAFSWDRKALKLTLGLRQIYGMADVSINNSVAEGFGMLLIESQACGTSVICPRNSAQTELAEGHGWLVENINPEDYIEFPIYVPTLQEYPLPSQRSLLERLEEAYNSPDLRLKYGRMARKFALNYGWDKIIPLWLRLLKQVEEELSLFDELGRVLRGPGPTL